MQITVVMPSIPTRRMVRDEALRSIRMQELQPADVIVQMDETHAGAALTRHAGLMAVKTPWVAFLDDDDMMMPHHLKDLLRHAEETECDYAYSWFHTIPLGCDPFPESHFLDPWDSGNPRQTTVTTLVRTSLAQSVGFITPLDADTPDGQRAGEDWDFTLGCNRLGKISHLVRRTWYWRHWGVGQPGMPGNTSGLGSRW
jgi:glycosyl transferase family 2